MLVPLADSAIAIAASKDVGESGTLTFTVQVEKEGTVFVSTCGDCTLDDWTIWKYFDSPTDAVGLHAELAERKTARGEGAPQYSVVDLAAAFSNAVFLRPRIDYPEGMIGDDVFTACGYSVIGPYQSPT